MGKLGRSIIKGLEEIAGTTKLHKNKSLWYRITTVFYTSRLLDPVFDKYYSLVGFIKNVKRVIEFIPYVWKHRDWDYSFILQFNHMLHKRLYKAIYVEGHHLYTPKQARRLQAVIELYKRLYEDRYSESIEMLATERFGPENYYFKPVTEVNGRTYISLGSTREDRLDKETIKKYIIFRKSQLKLARKLRKQDLLLLRDLITKYEDTWWD